MLSLLKPSVRTASGTRPFRALVHSLEWASSDDRRWLRVLTYHRIDEADRRADLSPRLISASPDDFARQMRWLSQRYCAVRLSDVREAVEAGRPLPRRALLLTFDDAYEDFALFAWPVLRELGLPATLFVPTGMVGVPGPVFWWDRLHVAVHRSPDRRVLETPWGRLPTATSADRSRTVARLHRRLKSLPHARLLAAVETMCGPVPEGPSATMTWPVLRRLADEGLELGAHTRSHPLLTRVPLEAAREEIVGGVEELACQTGIRTRAFAYPSGAGDRTHRALLRDLGFTVAFSTCRGVNRMGAADPLWLRRIHVGGQTPLPLIRAQLTTTAGHLINRLA